MNPPTATKAPTIQDVARHLGVSTSLVSSALNGKGGKYKVAPEKRQLILETAQQLGYDMQRNKAARALVAQRFGHKVRTNVLALLMPPVRQPRMTVQNNPFFLPYFCGVEIEASLRNYDLFVCAMRGDECPRQISAGGVDGVIAVHVDGWLRRGLDFAAMGLPAVVLGTSPPGYASVEQDDAAGILLAVRHLVELGHRRIAYLGIRVTGGPGAPVSRLQAYRDAVHACGAASDDRLIDVHADRMEFEVIGQMLDRLLARTDFTCLVCYNDWFAMGAIRRLQQLGRRVPQDVAVVGFDDLSEEYAFLPHLTSVRVDRQQMGRRAVALLCKALNEGQDLAVVCEKAPVELIRRETT